MVLATDTLIATGPGPVVEMTVRHHLVVLTGAGAETGRECALRLTRLGAAVLLVDTSVASLRETAHPLAHAGARTWTLEADVGHAEGRALLAARAQDLGGADLMVDASDAGSGPGRILVRQFVEALERRRGCSHPGAAVTITRDCLVPDLDPRARLMSVVVDAAAPAAPAEVARAAVALLVRGTGGQEVELTSGPVRAGPGQVDVR